jgi:hypothetical protein
MHKFHNKINKKPSGTPSAQPAQKNNSYKCDNCKTCFTRKDSLIRHLKKYCKNIDNIDILKNEIIELKESQKKELEKFKEEIIKLSQSNNNNNTINSNNTNNTNNTNNGTINNNINLIVPLGKENFSKVLSDAQKLTIVQANDKAIFKFTEMIYTEPEFEKYRNVSITNISGEFGNAYDEKVARYVLNKKIEILNKYGWNRLCDIEEFIDYLENKDIDVGNIDKLTVLIDRYAKDDEFKKIFNNELVIFLYNYNKNVKRNINRMNQTKNIEI